MLDCHPVTKAAHRNPGLVVFGEQFGPSDQPAGKCRLVLPLEARGWFCLRIVAVVAASKLRDFQIMIVTSSWLKALCPVGTRSSAGNAVGQSHFVARQLHQERAGDRRARLAAKGAILSVAELEFHLSAGDA